MSFRDNAAERRYEYAVGGDVTIGEYSERHAARAITHVETPQHARGQGHAAALMSEIVADARVRGLKLEPRCSYAAAWFERHPEAQDVLA
jgi:hypothetical protein